MAIYYCDLAVYGRPKATVPGAAYVSRSRLCDERAGKCRDFRHLATDLV